MVNTLSCLTNFMNVAVLALCSLAKSGGFFFSIFFLVKE